MVERVDASQVNLPTAGFARSQLREVLRMAFGQRQGVQQFEAGRPYLVSPFPFIPPFVDVVERIRGDRLRGGKAE